MGPFEVQIEANLSQRFGEPEYGEPSTAEKIAYFLMDRRPSAFEVRVTYPQFSDKAGQLSDLTLIAFGPGGRGIKWVTEQVKKIIGPQQGRWEALSFEQEQSIAKYARQDMALARREGDIMISDTKFGTVELTYFPTDKTYSIVSRGTPGKPRISIGKLSAAGCETRLCAVYDVVGESLSEGGEKDTVILTRDGNRWVGYAGGIPITASEFDTYWRIARRDDVNKIAQVPKSQAKTMSDAAKLFVKGMKESLRESERKLQIGSVIRVHGWVMLKGLEDGESYQVVSTPPMYGKDTYQFRKVGSKSRLRDVRHYSDSVDGWLGSNLANDNNRIEIVESLLSEENAPPNTPVAKAVVASKKNDEGEYAVLAYDSKNRRIPSADYFTNDKTDADQTAKAMVKTEAVVQEYYDDESGRSWAEIRKFVKSKQPIPPEVKSGVRVRDTTSGKVGNLISRTGWEDTRYGETAKVHWDNGATFSIVVDDLELAESQTVEAKQPIAVGDRVQYAKKFLQSTGQYTGVIPHAKGKVTGLIPLGTETTLAEIDWGSDRDEVPGRVNVLNLNRIGGFEEAVEGLIKEEIISMYGARLELVPSRFAKKHKTEVVQELKSLGPDTPVAFSMDQTPGREVELFVRNEALWAEKGSVDPENLSRRLPSDVIVRDARILYRP